jgi:hypothetical protein
MAVRIQKPAVNIREKLAELERPIGLKGSELMKSETAQEARDLVSAGRKNLIINGDMKISQRASSTNSAASGTYIVDRWQYEASTTGVVNVEQSTDAPPGFKYSSKITITTADSNIASTDFQQILYKMEGNDISHLNYGTSNAKTCTLSFWVKASKPAIFPFSFQNHDGTRVYPENYTVNQANTWEYKTIVFPGDTGGTWVTTGNSLGFRFTFQFMLGSSFTGGTRGAWAATTGYLNLCPPHTVNLQETNATFQLAGVQLEVGKNATEFEHRSYGEELALCQRYYYNTMFLNGANSYTAPTTNHLQIQGTRHRVADVTGYVSQTIFHPVVMRINPSITLYNPNNSGVSGQVYLHNFDGSGSNTSAISPQFGGQNNFVLWAYTGLPAVGTAGMSLISWLHWAASSEL